MNNFVKIFLSMFLMLISVVVFSKEIPKEIISFSDINVLPNGVDKFSFDPAYVIESKVSDTLYPVSIKLDERIKESTGYNHITLVDGISLSIGENIVNDGYIGIKDFKVKVNLPGQPKDVAKHIFSDIYSDRYPEALIMGVNSRFLTVLMGEENSTFDNVTKKISFSSPIKDLTSTYGENKEVVSILHDNHLDVYNIKSALAPSTNTRTHRSDNLFSRTNMKRFSFMGKGIKVASFHVGNMLTFAVLSKHRNKLRLTTFFLDKDAYKPEFTTSTILFSDDNEQGVAIALVDAYGKPNHLPKVIILSSTAIEGGDDIPDEGRLRIFSFSSGTSLIPLRNPIPQGKRGIVSLVKQKIDNDFKDYVEIRPNFSALKKIKEYKNRSCDNAEENTIVTAMHVADITSSTRYFNHGDKKIPKVDRSGSNGIPDIIIAGNIGLAKCGNRPFVQILNISASLQMERVAEKVIVKTYKQSSANQPGIIETDLDDSRIIDLAVSRFNSDDLPDIVLLDANSRDLILLRQQPQPCVTFITALTHGHQGGDSILREAGGLDNVGTMTLIDDYNMMLTSKVEEINQYRRIPDLSLKPTKSELCPIANISINGHWEEATSHGAFYHILGRAGWLVSALTPTPVCMQHLQSLNISVPPLDLPLGTPLPHVIPLDYWSSYFWLFMPYVPQPLCPSIPPIPNTASALQLVLMGFGMGTEFVGAEKSGVASRTTAVNLSNAINKSTKIARQSMDSCTGQIALDTVGFSRGTTVTSNAMQQVDMSLLRYNSDASIIYLDAIDPSWGVSSINPIPFTSKNNGDSIRPWARSGYIVSDPKVAIAGSALISSVYSQTPDILSIDYDFIRDTEQSVLNHTHGIIHRDIVGLPSGYNRTSNLPTSNRGWFSASSNLTHNGVRDAILSNPNPTTTPIGYTNQSSSFADGTHLGDFLKEPRLPVPNYTGWRRDVEVTKDDTNYLPEKCKSSISASGAVKDTSNSKLEEKVTEFVADPDFNLAQGIVANARDLIFITENIPSFNKEYKLDKLISGINSKSIRDYIKKTAEKGLPIGDGVNDWSGKYQCSNCPILLTDENSSRIPQFKERSGKSLIIPSNLSDGQVADEMKNQWAAQISKRNGSLDSDQINLLSLIAAGATRIDDALLVFGDTNKEIKQQLLHQSIYSKKLVVRVFYKQLIANGELSVTIKGNGINTTKKANSIGLNILSDFMFEVERGASRSSNTFYPDSITLEGKNIHISSISVQPQKPWKHPSNGHYYEVIQTPHGVDWEAAQKMAQQRLFNGKQGKLAEFPENDAKKIINELNIKYPVWVGAKGKMGDKSSNHWITSGKKIDSSLIDLSTESTREDDSYLYYQPNGSMFSSGLRVTIKDEPIGFLIYY